MYQYMGKLAALAAVIWAISCLTGCAAAHRGRKHRAGSHPYSKPELFCL